MNKLKKVLILFFVLLMILSLFSWDRFHKYKGDDYDLFTVAINSVLDQTGKSFREAPALEIKEQDNYGRTMFYYHERGYISQHNLIIAQKSDDEFVYYYEDYNFISKSENEFSSEDIEALKSANDWNKPINENKLIKKAIVKEKQENLIDEKIKDMFIQYDNANNFHGGESEMLRYYDYKVTALLSGPLGGDQQIGAMIAEGKIDVLIFFCDNLITQGHQQDVGALVRLASLYNIPFATNRTTADMIITSSLLGDVDYERIIPECINRYKNRAL